MRSRPRGGVHRIAWCLGIAAVAIAGCDRSDAPGAAAADSGVTLTILTPHNEAIRDAFGAGFAGWYARERGSRVSIQWIVRGTPQCVEYIEKSLGGSADEFRGAIPDVMFGGGIADHRELRARGLSRPVDIGDRLAGIPPDVAGLPTRDPDRHWFGTGLSSFGIIYNSRACRERGIEAPATWADLADPRFAGWIGLADPAASGSHRECMLLILQHLGWDRGWPTLMGILANARAVNRRSADALNGVQSGVFLASFAVNFDGMRLAAESGGDLVYIDPPGATAISPDVVSVINAPRPDAAAVEFVRYLLSVEGQLLWAGAAAPAEGRLVSLYHYPILPEVYAKHASELSVAGNPYTRELGVKFDLTRADLFGALLPALVSAAAGENHVRLQRAAAAADAAGRQVLFAVPFDEAAARDHAAALGAAEPTAAQTLLSGWAGEFRKRCEAVLGGAS